MNPIFLIIILSFVATLIFVLFCLFVSWAVDHTSTYQPYQGTFIQYLGDKFRTFINLLKDIV